MKMFLIGWLVGFTCAIILVELYADSYTDKAVRRDTWGEDKW